IGVHAGPDVRIPVHVVERLYLELVEELPRSLADPSALRVGADLLVAQQMLIEPQVVEILLRARVVEFALRLNLAAGLAEDEVAAPRVAVAVAAVADRIARIARLGERSPEGAVDGVVALAAHIEVDGQHMRVLPEAGILGLSANDRRFGHADGRLAADDLTQSQRLEPARRRGLQPPRRRERAGLAFHGGGFGDTRPQHA